MSKHRLVVVGGGNMGSALVGGLLSADWSPDELAIVERMPQRASQLGGLFPEVAISDTMVPGGDVLLAVKPADVAEVAAAAVDAGATRILSIAAGVSVAALREACGDNVAVVRGMPNLPALLGKGASAVAADPGCSEADLRWAEKILRAVGTVVRVSEAKLDVITSLTGSGPALLFLVAESLVDAGVLAGLPRSVSEHLVRQLFAGTAALLDEREGDAAALRAEVTSPGGVTAAALRVLEQRATRSSFLEAVMAGAERSRELGDGSA